MDNSEVYVRCNKCGGFFSLSEWHLHPCVPRSVRLEREPDDEGYVSRVGSGDVADPGIRWAEKREATRKAEVGSDVVVPLLWALISSLAVAATWIVAGLGAAWAGWRVPPETLLKGAALVAVFAFVLSWWAFMRLAQSSLMRTERYERAEPERPRAPDVARPAVRLEVKEERQGAGPRWIYGELPIDEEALVLAAKKMRAGASFSYADMTEGARSPLTRNQFVTLRGWLLRNGLASWVDENNRRLGLSFPATGEQFWRRLAGEDDEAE